jgi:hypothetical protein
LWRKKAPAKTLVERPFGSTPQVFRYHRFTLDGKSVKLADLKSGEAATVTATKEDSIMLASKIEATSAKKK